MEGGQEQCGRMQAAVNVARAAEDKAKASLEEASFAYDADPKLQKERYRGDFRIGSRAGQSEFSVAQANLQQAIAGFPSRQSPTIGRGRCG